MSSPIISVLMPVYNGGSTIKRSLQSLLKQGQVEMELVVVNDCSTDNTSEVLESFAQELPDTITLKVIHQKQNGGVAVARNTALDQATGKYILWLDADDYYAPHAFEQLLQVATGGAELIAYGYQLQNQEHGREIAVPQGITTPMHAFSLMAEGRMKWNLWAFMLKRELVEQHAIRFLPHENMGEDLYFMGQVLLNASQIATLHKPLYHYIISNEESLTKSYRPEHLKNIIANVSALEQVVVQRHGAKFNTLLGYLKLTLKLPFLYTLERQQYRNWQSTFPEANSYISTYPTPHRYNRLLQRWAERGQFTCITLFNKVYQLAYRLRFR